MDVFSFVVRHGAVMDADLLLADLRRTDAPNHDIERLRVILSQIAGPRKVIVEVNHGRIAHSERPLPAAPTEIKVSARPIRDVRSSPERLGPDLGWQRFQLAATHADEGLLVDAHGRVVSSLLRPLVTFVSPHEVMVSQHPASPRTWALEGVLRVLAEHGVRRTLLPKGFIRHGLFEYETWIIDPVYGARLITQWNEYGTTRRGAVMTERAGTPTHVQTTLLRKARADLL